MPSTIGGGAATTTRRAVTTPRAVWTRTRSSRCSIRLTGARRATTSPSRFARRSGTSWEPPTKRRSWAPSTVSELRAKVPTVRSLPEQATYQRTNSSESPRGSSPKPGWLQHSMRLLTPAGLSVEFWRMKSSRVIESHSRARGCDQGASTAISAA